ncbi:hypothetical protein [Paraburkholderia sp. C35]|uniref:hypothetical protein n=1 Tax=Paraburkholderia sp. C35 TaxID=2126993 RepID=UPI0013A5B4DA|nr:hypothetical protein [Paraburkholderia sp. C35]
MPARQHQRKHGCSADPSGNKADETRRERRPFPLLLCIVVVVLLGLAEMKLAVAMLH